MPHSTPSYMDHDGFLMPKDFPADAFASALEYAAQFGIFFLVLLAGIEMEPEHIARRSKGAFLVALGGLLLPLLAGFLQVLNPRGDGQEAHP